MIGSERGCVVRPVGIGRGSLGELWGLEVSTRRLFSGLENSTRVLPLTISFRNCAGAPIASHITKESTSTATPYYATATKVEQPLVC